MTEFTDYLQEVFEDFGPIHTKRMFGGYGVYYNDIMFALVEDDILFLKADETIAKDFTERCLGQFEYAKGGKVIRLSYYQAPEELLEDRDMACEWAKKSYKVALESKKK